MQAWRICPQQIIQNLYLESLGISEQTLNTLVRYWLLPLIFGWTGLKSTVTPTFTKSFSFLNRVNSLIFFKKMSTNLELLNFQKTYGLWGYLLKAKALAPINARRVLEGG